MNRGKWWKKFQLIWVQAGLVAALLCGVMQQAVHATENWPDEISVSQAKAKRDAGALILDVREQSEWEQIRIPGAVHIPLGQLEAGTSELPRNKEIVVVCRSGGRSQIGRDILRKAGFSMVTSMEGGVIGWKAAGYPAVSGP